MARGKGEAAARKPATEAASLSPTLPPYVPGVSPAQPVLVGPRRPWRLELAVWWREIDLVLLALVVILMMIGVAAVAAASPASVHRMNIALKPGERPHPDLQFLWQHLIMLGIGVLALLRVSLLPRERARRWAITLGAAAMVGLVLVLVPGLGMSVNGARRWLRLGIQFQPSEFLKPAYAVILAWILSWRRRDPGLPVLRAAGAMIVLVAMLVMAEKDLGTTILFVSVGLVMLILAGLPVGPRVIGGALGVGAVGLAAVMEFYDNGRNRILSFVDGCQPYDQVCLAKATLLAGGWNGTGLWLGMAKARLPEAHTDYIFSVIGEEYGLRLCLVVIVVNLLIVMRVVRRVREEDDPFIVLAAIGLAAQFGTQAFINILVNVQLAPSKGMTLPLISYGGSSTVATCLVIGFLLALTRRNPYLGRVPLGQRPTGAGTGGVPRRAAVPSQPAETP